MLNRISNSPSPPPLPPSPKPPSSPSHHPLSHQPTARSTHYINRAGGVQTQRFTYHLTNPAGFPSAEAEGSTAGQQNVGSILPLRTHPRRAGRVEPNPEGWASSFRSAAVYGREPIAVGLGKISVADRPLLDDTFAIAEAHLRRTGRTPATRGSGRRRPADVPLAIATRAETKQGRAMSLGRRPGGPHPAGFGSCSTPTDAGSPRLQRRWSSDESSLYSEDAPLSVPDGARQA